MDSQMVKHGRLTAFDYEVVRLFAQGHNQAEIASEGGFATSAVKDLFDRSKAAYLFNRMEGVPNRQRLLQWWADITHIATEYPEEFFDIAKLDRLRIEGNALAVIEDTRKNKALLRGFLDRYPKSSNRQTLLNLVAKLNILEGLALEDSSTNTEYFHKISPIIRELSSIAVELNDRQSNVFALTFDALKHFKIYDYRTCMNRLSRALPYIHTVCDYYEYLKMIPVSGALITSARLGNKKLVEKNDAYSQEVLQTSPLTDQEKSSDGLRMRARAWSMLKNQKAIKLIEDSWKEFETIPTPTPRQGAKLVKATLEIARRIPGALDRAFIETQTNKWLQLAKLHHLRYHIVGIEDRLKTYLNQ